MVKYVRPDGSDVPEGICMMPDNVTTTFTVTVRGLRKISAAEIKRQLQQRYEVTDIQENDTTMVVK